MSARTMHEINVIGTMNLFAAARPGEHVRDVVVKSSTLVYGAAAGPVLVPRGRRRAPRRPADRVEQSLRGRGLRPRLRRGQPARHVTLLRFSNVLGPDIVTPLSKALELPLVPSILGFDPRFQFVHEDDVIRSILFVLDHDSPASTTSPATGCCRGARSHSIAASAPFRCRRSAPAWPPRRCAASACGLPARAPRPAAVRPRRRQPAAEAGRASTTEYTSAGAVRRSSRRCACAAPSATTTRPTATSATSSSSSATPPPSSATPRRERPSTARCRAPRSTIASPPSPSTIPSAATRSTSRWSTRSSPPFDALEADEDVGAVVVTGAPPAFCAGADLSHLGGRSDGGLRSVYEGFLRVGRSPLPTIAAVNGAAVGAGMNLALGCDVRLAGASARFDTRFLQLGIHPGGGTRGCCAARRTAGRRRHGAVRRGARRRGGRAGRPRVALRRRRRAARRPRGHGREGRRGAASCSCGPRRRSRHGHIDDHDEAVDRELEPQVWSIASPSSRERLAAMQAQHQPEEPSSRRLRATPFSSSSRRSSHSSAVIA